MREGEAIDVAWASDQIDRLIERRSGGRNAAVEDLWEASVEKDKERQRRALRAEWFRYWSALASSLRASAEEFERRAEQLLEEPDR